MDIRLTAGRHRQGELQMKHQKKGKNRLLYTVILRTVKLLDVLLLTLPFAAVWYGYYGMRIVAPYRNQGNWVILLLFAALYIINGRIYDAFLVSYQRVSDLIFSQTLAAFLSDFMLYLVCWVLSRRLPSVWPILLAFAAQILLAALWASGAHRLYFALFPTRRTVVVWEVRAGLERLIHQYGLSRKFQVNRVIDAAECMADLSVLEDAETVFLADVPSHPRNKIIKYCVEKDISVFMIPRVGDVMMSGAHRMHMFHLPMLRLDRCDPTPEYLFFKRVFDLLVSGAALLLLSPVMLITAICIRKSDGGPVFYRQCRMTKNGEEFQVLKFRSMKVDAERDGIERLSSGDKDDRVTPVGKVIRKLRIDELPQLFNVLSGKMSIVGPRPERPAIARQYEKELPEFRLRLQVKAGLTGYAQVYGKYNTTPYDKLLMDLLYIARPGILQDMAILFATVKVLFSPESTEGIGEGQTTAAAAAEDISDGGTAEKQKQETEREELQKGGEKE